VAQSDTMPKRRCVSSHDVPPTKIPRDQSKIAKSWWEKKRKEKEDLSRNIAELNVSRERLSSHIDQLRVEKAELERRNVRLRHKGKEVVRVNVNLCEEKRELKMLTEELQFEKGALEEDYAAAVSKLEIAENEKVAVMASLREAERMNASLLGPSKVADKQTRVELIGAMLVTFLACIMKGTHAISRLRTVCDCIFGAAVFGATATKAVLSEVHKKYILAEHQRTFSNWRVLRAIDLSPVSGLNYNGVEILRSVEELGKYERGVLPSRSSIQKCSAELYQMGQELIPFHRKECALGEVYQYDFEKAVCFIVQTFGLYELAQRESVELNVTFDGAEICDGLCHLTAGIKMTDGRAVDPTDGMPLSFMEEGVGRLFNTQSRNYCFALKSLLGRDTKEAYKEFADFFSFFESLKNEGLPASPFGPRIQPIIVLSTQDLSSVWKCLGTGSGARKNGNTHFCHLCPCTGGKIAEYKVGDNR